MAKSLSYYIMLIVIKIKRLKNIFSQDPLDYKLLRREDVHFPKQAFYSKENITRFNLMNSAITQIKKESKKLVIYIHGGAFVSGPSKHHWDTIKTISEFTNFNLWMCDYPKAPENKISFINKNIDFVYETAKNSNNFDEIVLIGDSAGATLILTLIQRKIQTNFSLPSKIILISPVLDASFENPEISNVDKKDPMLSVKGVLSAKKMCAENNDLKNKNISPLFGDFNGFPSTYLFLAENDITYPDQLILCQKLNELNIEHYTEMGIGMPHIWPILPFMKESGKALKSIIQILNQ